MTTPRETERSALEARLAHLEKMESVGRLAGGIAHDFNNLLTAILGYSELLLSNRSLDDADRSALEEIQKAGTRAAALTQQLLAFSRKQVLLPQEVDLNRTVLGLEGMLTRLIREDITLTCEVADAAAFVKIDPTQIEQAILNLVLNARDALPAGGRIRIDVSRVAARDVVRPADVPSAEEYVRLRVSDNGVGISDAARTHLFEPFFTTKEQGKGTGLGLASVHGIVHQSQGWIEVASEPGRGTTFAMHFPAVKVQPSPSPDVPAIVEPARGHETILLVEDEDAVRLIVGTVLRRQGYTVIESGTPDGAIELFDRHGKDIDLLLTDVVMPGMNGPALAQRLVGIRPTLRVLFMSGYTNMLSPELPNRHVGFLSKPFQSTVLIARVQEMLSRPVAERVV